MLDSLTLYRLPYPTLYSAGNFLFLEIIRETSFLNQRMRFQALLPEERALARPKKAC